MSQLDAERKTLEVLAEEFVARYRRGERPALSEYFEAHPELADEIRELFPTLVLMEELAPSDSDSSVPPPSPLAPLPSGERGWGEGHLSIGDYRLLREIGRGGMGIVYEAEQLSLGRRVALKVLHRHAAGDSTLRQRFHREARAAAQLHHTNIVPVFEVGEDQDTCWYAMQLILSQGLDQIIEELRHQHQSLNGERPAAPRTNVPPARPPLSQVTQALVSGQFACPDLDPSTPPPAPAEATSGQACLDATDSTRLANRSELSIADSAGGPYYRSVARIGRQAAEALAHAHARGIIHRDIKPSNLLLDTAGVVWITDFGLAKTQETALTNTGDLVGTLRYMAPERFLGEGDERADVYGLGLMLYEMLVLRPAFVARDRLQLIDQIKNQEPARPRALDRRIPRDLETIVLTAIHKEPKRRYQTAEAMAEDLRRFLANEPIQAKRTSQLERLRLWSRRNPALAALLLVLALVAAASMATAFYLRATLLESEKNRRHAEKAELEGKQELWLSYLSQAQARRMSRQSGQRFASLRAIKAALALPVPPGHSRDELRTEAIAALCLPDLELAREGGRETIGVRGLTIDSAFQRYAWADKDGNVRICRLSDDEELLQLPGDGWVSEYDGLQFSPDGRFLRHVCHTPRGLRSRLWDLDAPKPKAVLDDDHNGLAFRPDSREVAASYRDRTVRFFDPASGRELRRFTLDMTRDDQGLSWNPKLPQLLLVGKRTSMRLLNVDTGTMVEVGLKVAGGYSWMAWHPEGRLLAVSGEWERKIYLWDVPTGRLVMPPLEDHKDRGVGIRFNHAGDRLLSSDWSGSGHLWDAHSGRLLLTVPGINYAIFSFSPDDRLVGTRSGRMPSLYHFRRGEELRTVVHRNKTGQSNRFDWSHGSPCLAPEGRLFAIGVDKGVALVDLARGEVAALLSQPGNMPLRFDAEGVLWTHGMHGLLHWPAADDPKTGQRRYGPPQRVFPPTNVDPHGSSPDARVVAIPDYGCGALIFHRDSKRQLRLGPQEDVRFCAVSPDGLWVATGSHGLREGAGAKVWNAQNGRHVKDLPVGRFCRVQFSPDGKWLLTTSGGPRLWAVGTWEEGPKLAGTSLNGSGAFSGDGKLLALGDEAFGVVRLVVTDTGTEIARLTAPEQARLHPCCFTPDGSQLITAGVETSALHVFDLRAIRAGLAELDLDWDAPPLSTAPRGANATPLLPAPLSIRFELGDIRQRTQAEDFLKRAAAFVRQGELAKAEAAYREAIRLKPDWASPHNNLAWLLATCPDPHFRDPRRAVELAKKAIELAPAEGGIWNTLGVAPYRAGDWKAAVQTLKKSMDLRKGGNSFDWFFLAMAHWHLGEKDQARHWYGRAVQWMDKNQPKNDELRRFRREAAELLGMEEKSD